MSVEESEALINYLSDFKVRWAPETLTIWYNRSTNHLVVIDYTGKARRTYRVTIDGDRRR